MCGIVGVLDHKRTRSEAETTALLEAMSAPMFNRGPDASGTWIDESAGTGFGHRRLSILDLSEAGAQPMISADGRWVITYNGEIYDRDELHADLQAAGTRLRGHSDTELLVEAIARWGISTTLERIDGMFAFGVWDREQRELTLARDRMGEKPLYHGHLPNGEFVFGSSLDALAVHPAFERTIDRDSLALFFRYKYVPAPRSIYQSIHKLEPGHTLTITADGKAGEPVTYWSYFEVIERGATFAGSPSDAVDELEHLLRRSVRRRMVADVPVGTFLSGGIDSSTIAAIAQQETATPIHTFTIGSSDAGFDESVAARAMANHLGTHHTELMVSDADVIAVIGKLGSIYDEPFADSSQVPTRLVSEMARRDVTVALSGDAGDELFAGYNRYVWAPAIWRRLERIPASLRSTVAGAGDRVPPVWWDRVAKVIPASKRPRMVGLKVSKVLGVADSASPYEVFHRLVSDWRDPAALVTGATEPLTIHTDPTRWPDVVGFVDHMAAVDGVTYLSDDILTKVDRAAMSVSLETRVPLLDRAIVEFAAGLPLELKIRDGKTKWPLRQILGRYVPTEMFERPKAGFGIPLESWLRGPLRDWAAERLFESDAVSILNSDMIRAAWDEHQSGRRNRSREIWDVVMFAEWAAGRTTPIHEQVAGVV